VVVDAGGRLELVAPPGDPDHEVVVLECPAVRAGVTTQGRVAELDLGLAVDLPPGEAVHVWNEGPGPLVTVVRRRRRRRSRPA